MKCLHCGAENQEQAKFCSECGERLSIPPESPVPANPSDATVDSRATEKKHSSGLKSLRKVAGGIVVLIFISNLLLFVMGITKVPRDLWQSGVEDDTKREILNELLAAGFPDTISVQSTTSRNVHDSYIELDFDYRLLFPWNFSNDSVISSVFFQNFDRWKGAFVYDIYETWQVSVDTTSLGTVETTTTIVCQPKWSGEHLYTGYVNLEPSDGLYAAGEEYAQNRAQSILEDKFQFQHFYLYDINDWYLGNYQQFVIEYQWTNTGNHAKSPFTDVSISAYQNGIELKTDYSYNQPYDALTNIAAGETITNSIAFILNDPYSDIEVRAANYLAEFSGDSSEIVKTVPLNNNVGSTFTPGTSGNQSGTGLYADYNLSFYDGSYADNEDSVNITLTAQPSGTEFYCELFWIYGRYTEEGIVCPGIPTQLSGGTIVTIDLDASGNVHATLAQDGPDSFSYSFGLMKID